MQPTEYLSQPRRALDIEDYIDILRRHKGWILGPFLLVLVGSVVGVHLWPDTYESVAVVSIKPPQISEALIKGQQSQDIVERVSRLSEQVLSRTELGNLIRNLNLYPRDINRIPTEDILERMRKDITITARQSLVGGRTVPAFEVRFRYENRIDANKVVTTLVGNFVNENLKDRDRNTYQQQEFLQAQTDRAKKDLDEIDRRITEFRLANPGKSPDQMSSTLSALSTVQNNLLSLQTAANRVSTEKLQLETNIRIAQDQISALQRQAKAAPIVAPKIRNPRLIQAENQLENLQVTLSSARKRYQDSHPDVRTLLGQIEVVQQQVNRLQAEDNAKEPEVTAPPVDLALQRELRTYEASIQALEGQIKAKDLEAVSLERQQKQANDQLMMLNSRISSAPVGDQMFNELLREESLAKEQYLNYSQALERARLMVDMEGRKQGETLEVLDAATLAQEPLSPDRPMVIGIGAAMGLVLGVVIAGAREMKDTSLKNLKDVRAYTQMAILGSVPLLENDFVVRRRRRVAWLGWTVACLAAAVVMSASVVYYYQTKN